MQRVDEAMNPTMQKNGAFTVEKNEMLALESGRPISVSLFLQGKLDVYITPPHRNPPEYWEDLKYSSFRLFGLDQNLFIGVNDILSGGKNSLSICATADCSLFAHAAESAQDVWSLLQSQKEYGAYIVNSLCNLILNSHTALQKADAYLRSLQSIYSNLGAFYAAQVQEYGLEKAAGAFADDGGLRLAELRDSGVLIPLHFSRSFTESRSREAVDLFPAKSGLAEKIAYFSQLYGLPVDLRKAFFCSDSYIASYHIKEASLCLDHILSRLRHVFGALSETIDGIYSDGEGCAYRLLLHAAAQLNAKSLDCTPACDSVTYICEKLKEITAYLEWEYNHKTGIDFQYLEHAHSNALAAFGPNTAGGESETSLSDLLSNGQSLPEELKDSAKKILEYSGIPDEAATEFLMHLTAFRNLRDRLSTDDTAKAIRSAVSEKFFDIYKAVFKKAYHTRDSSRLIPMFLNYGYMDEKLLYNDQVLALYKLAGREDAASSPNIHTMQDWLSRIVEMERDPSVNQFGQDYFDIFRELKKQGRVADKDKMAYDNDTDARLTFETGNMFSTNHKLCQGQISTYFPILHRDMAPRNPVRSLVTPALIRSRLERILDIDFSAFHREINYRNPALGIEKEIVMMQVIPDFILMPVYGTRAVMWQEIAGRVRSAPGRLLIPIFTDENLDDMLVKLVGNFRWELCRTMMGSAWNDVTQSSLTADYTDYIQFYKKNRDLSDEAKEKIKAQIAKYHNRTRDIFTSDYEIWINYEAKSNPRLNRVARSIFFRHCPFSRSVREQLERQPMYADLVGQLRNQRAKMARELEGRYGKYAKAGGVWDPVLEENLAFFRNL
jgi:hypothetical protein